MKQFDGLRPGRGGLEDLIREYLSPGHRDNPGDGCPNAALLDEIGGCGDEAKAAYTDGAKAILDEFAARLAPEDPQSARGQAIGLFTMMVGTLQLSRALSDRKFSDEVLAQGIENTGLEQIVRRYLSPWHRDSRDLGCPSAALLDEIGRCTHPTRQAYTDGVLVVADGIAARLAPGDPLSVRTMALSAYAMMAGTLQLARALADPHLADQVLEQGIHNALALLGVEHEGDTRTAH
ncbi:TetR/AcrR family transcriptional regulator [Streptomyces scabiei]|uniref:TetR/AcrR family transcriptional regulator n=1 Tax=Streptomyces scabiei TaxID=1930 RepID=UPI000A53DB39|nr:TetR/AcrR family transcriptional regulator [Streptomyces scabiei]